MWKAVKEFDQGMDIGTGMGFYFTLWSSLVGLHFLCDEKRRKYNIKIHEENESYAEHIGAEIGMRIGFYSAVVCESALLIATLPYSLGVLAATNTAGYFYYKRKMRERQQEKRLQLPHK